MYAVLHKVSHNYWHKFCFGVSRRRCLLCITVRSRVCNCISNHRPLVFVQQLVQTNNTENIKDPHRTDPLWEESTGILLTKGQWHIKDDVIICTTLSRRTFYYLFNIIVPCMMLSVLTLLTFWLPTTSGEKISLGLSVFLAFSMFMLLIAEEVPATSESVPLIG